MQTLPCSNPDCAHVFSEPDWNGKASLECPRCHAETMPPEKGALPDMLLPPALPAEAAASTSITRDPYLDIPTGRPVSDEEDRRRLDISKGYYYLLVDGRRVGPLTKTQLIGAGLDYFSLVWYPGAKGWKPARNVDGLQDVFHYVPPPAPGPLSWANVDYLPRPHTFHNLYWWFFWLCMGVFFFLILMLTFLILWDNVRLVEFRGHRNPTFEILLILSGMTALMFAVASVAVYVTLLYQMWKVVQDGVTPLSPGAAVGLLFIPFFNLFWIFIALRGLAYECNMVIQRHGYQARPAPVGLALANCICLLIPWVNAFVLFPMALITMGMLRNTAADIAQARIAEDMDGEGRDGDRTM